MAARRSARPTLTGLRAGWAGHSVRGQVGGSDLPFAEVLKLPASRPPAMSPPLPPTESVWPRHLAVLGLVVAALLAWANSFSGPFVFDDRPAILANPTLANFVTALSPPRDGGTVAGRPLVNLTFAFNRALSGTDVRSYHGVNLLIHLLAALTLFGVVRRTVAALSPRFPSPGSAVGVAFAAALLWLVHPLQTAAVTYVIQRAESLMALCLLLTLYGFVRGWRWLSVVACLAGMFCKEVMAVAPIIILLYDRTFVTGTFRAALRGSWRYYLALAATWLPLAWLVSTNAARAGTAGFTGKIAPLDYALTSCGAIVHYLALAFWPRGLVFDYGTPLVTSFSAVGPQVLFLAGLVVVTVVGLRRGRALGFLGACFFLVLAPSSSLVPVATQTIAEHRMYLPLAALAIGVALGLYRLLRHRAVLAAVALALPLTVATARRNTDYRDALTLWSDTAQKRPDNARAQNQVGNELALAGRHAEAVAHFETALRLAPDDAEVHNNLGNVLSATGRAGAALPHYEASVRLKPASAPAQLNLAQALRQAGRATEAIAHYEAAESIAPLDADAQSGLGVALAEAGRAAEAIPRYESALRLKSDHAAAHYNLGLALVRTNRVGAATEHFRAAARSDPANVAARVNLGNALLLTNQAAAAISEYEAALRLRPDDPQIRANLARARALAR